MGRFSYNFDDSVVSQVPTHEGVNLKYAFTHVWKGVGYWNEDVTGEMRQDFAE